MPYLVQELHKGLLEVFDLVCTGMQTVNLYVEFWNHSISQLSFVYSFKQYSAGKVIITGLYSVGRNCQIHGRNFTWQHVPTWAF